MLILVAAWIRGAHGRRKEGRLVLLDSFILLEFEVAYLLAAFGM